MIRASRSDKRWVPSYDEFFITDSDQEKTLSSSHPVTTKFETSSSWLPKGDAVGGVALIFATLLALYFSNSSLSPLYNSLLQTKISVSVGDFALAKPLLLWINDGMMAVFFFLVGLELKRELLDGQLSDARRASLPLIAAGGGILLPALIYTALNFNDPETMKGWAIPAATDIAFALGILALLGSRVPAALKVFLLAVAIIDDLAAIVIIALFYTADLSLSMLTTALAGMLALGALNRFGVTRLAPYVLVGAVIWIFLLKSGVHATLAGVVVALFVPNLRSPGRDDTLLVATEHALKPWVHYGVMPAFAFANAGVALGALSADDLTGPISLGIILGLFFGKQLGVFGFTWAAVRFGLANLPQGVTWAHVYGASLLAGIGFTMSLFIGTLAFDTPEQMASVRIGVLVASLLSGVVGYCVLRWAIRGHSDEHAIDNNNPRLASQQP
jgi:Na+:H+ antiporter, NhaA family